MYLLTTYLVFTVDKLVLRSNSGGAGDSHYLFIDNYPTSRDLGISSQLQFIDYCDQRNLVMELLMHIVAKKIEVHYEKKFTKLV